MPTGTWMTDLYNGIPQFSTRPLSEITLPATHDAGGYVIHKGWGGESYTSLYARTQDQNIGLQLAGGIRYFDIRPTYTRAGTFWTYHGPAYIGGQIDGDDGVLADVANFMDRLGANDKELVILNISHFSNFNNVRHLHFIQCIQDILGNHLIQFSQAQLNLFGASYASLLNDSKGSKPRSRVAIIYDGTLDTVREDYITKNSLPVGFFVLSPKYAPSANNIYLYDDCANSNKLDDMQADQINKLVNRDSQVQPFSMPSANWPANAVGGTANTLHSFSWILTPALRGYPTVQANGVSNPALEALFCDNNWGNDTRPYNPLKDPKINIIYVDLYASHVHNHWGCQRHDYAMPVAIAENLNRYTPALQGFVAVPASFVGWGAF